MHHYHFTLRRWFENIQDKPNLKEKCLYILFITNVLFEIIRQCLRKKCKLKISLFVQKPFQIIQIIF